MPASGGTPYRQSQEKEHLNMKAPAHITRLEVLQPSKYQSRQYFSEQSDTQKHHASIIKSPLQMSNKLQVRIKPLTEKMAFSHSASCTQDCLQVQPGRANTPNAQKENVVKLGG